MSVYGTPGTAEYQRNWRAANPGMASKHQATYATKHPERVAAARQRTIDKAKADPAAHNARVRANRKGVPTEQYEALLAKQYGLCAICGITEEQNGRAFDLDHDHGCCPGERTCGLCIRGLLCGRCNRGIGMFDDNPDMLRAALRYLTPTGWPV